MANDVNLADLYECNQFFCPGQEISDADRRLHETVGVIPPPAPPSNYARRNFRISSQGFITATAPAASVSPQDAMGEAAALAADSGSESSGGKNSHSDTVNENPNGEQPQNYGSTSSANRDAPVQTAALQVQNPNGKVTRVGGMVYADDEDNKPKPIEAPGETSSGTLAQTLNTGTSNVAANRGFDTGGESDDSGGGRSMASSGGSGAGQFGEMDNSPTPTRSTPTGNNSLGSKLASLAAAMGSKFMSATGLGGNLGSKSGQNGSGGAHRGLASKKGLKVGGNGQSIDPNLLKDRYGRYLRSTASRMEFGASDGFMFGSMCRHYASYARKHRIPYDVVGCPKK